MKGFLYRTIIGYLLLTPGSISTATESSDPIGILLAAGDISNCVSSRSRYKEVAGLIGQEIAAAGATPIKVLALGDIAYMVKDRNTGKIIKRYSECFQEFERSWGVYKDYLLPVPGNHDYDDDDGKASETYFTYFDSFYRSVPNRAPNGSYVMPFPEGHPNAWALVAYNWYRGRDEELKHLIRLLRESQNDCIIGFAHPFFVSSGHWGGKYKDLTFGRMKGFFDALHNFGAEALISAHDHHFEQFKAIGLEGEEDSSGVRQFVVGTGGAPLYSSEASPRHSLSEYFDRKSHGLLKLQLYADRYTWSFVPIDNSGPLKLPSAKARCRTP